MIQTVIFQLRSVLQYNSTIIQYMYHLYSVHYTVVPSFSTSCTPYTVYSCTIIQFRYHLYSVQYTGVPSFSTCTTYTVYVQYTVVPLFRTCTAYTVNSCNIIQYMYHQYSVQFTYYHSVYASPIQCTVVLPSVFFF